MSEIRLLAPADGETILLLNDEYRAYLAGRYVPDGAQNKDRPLETVFSYKGEPGGVLHLKDDEGECCDIPIIGSDAHVSCLKTGMRYTWNVTRGGDASETRSFVTEKASPRWIHVSGVANFRDTGGRTARDGAVTRQGLFYRSSEWNSHEVLLEEGEKLLTDVLKVKTEIDLRGRFEAAWPGADTNRIDWKQFPVVAYGPMFEGESAQHARRLFRLLSMRSTYPAVVHCWGGMDRTATVTAMVQALCGVPFDEIERDYCNSSFSHGGIRHPEYPGWPEFRKMLLRYPGDEEKSAREILRDIGVTDGESSRIRAILRGEDRA